MLRFLEVIYISNYFDDAIEARLLSLHTIYLAKILSTNGNTATIQPLNMIKQFGKEAQKQAPIPDVPIANHCRGRIIEKIVNDTSVLAFDSLKAGNIVICACGERDISNAKNGKISLPTNRHHSLSDSIILGVL